MTITSAEFSTSSTKLSQCPNNLPEVAFIGRSNVGKSSLINMLVGKKNLCKTSSTPGKTKLINHFIVNNEMYFVDLPGYGYAKISKVERDKLEMMISSFIINDKNLKKLYILVDSRHEPMNIDLTFIENVFDINIDFAIVLTKCDKISLSKQAKHVEIFKRKIAEFAPEHKFDIIKTSSNGFGKDELLENIFNAIK
ncbi:ribosome biogenesis GTP-binding protein YihA/YsxC [Odoribacter sp. OttesenSCG-928-L07]|nr:ribosome biogenesis GTP-binding protein YihA/YsxC [Odoribacter sp. OttesenSCG-928-L07]MDL2239203.1 ribosome biogenesis GTP-binding protein YihA/YsxC [Bacteroidales bacterium OttesenSCG-928-L14]MDL2240547.1 ribosome biogenesis GTP-binding protein YihA/YsxC [Bacteroidales bacterium OttesenSCG-928-K22]